ncbi:MAG: ribosome biogenesis GTP-binding protein YihA/YsxC [Acholeplasmatales bacterium]|nr:ribosome biogenesis GTP-binding protein YihA/YsxC [Acholeplasmatales bacterium]
MIIKNAEFIKSAVDEASLPEADRIEVMFCGRSNVGKSSFINMVTNRKKLAKTSSNPGKTQTLNFFLINDDFYLVDVPGYGFANVAKSIKATFGKMIEDYVMTRENLKMVFLLVDFRHKPTEDDIAMYHFVKYYNRPVTIIATKSDKIKNIDRKKHKQQIIDALELDENDRFIITSSEKREGLGNFLTILDEVTGHTREEDNEGNN